jgi:DNA-binding NarL/FixJ family response regulator
MKRTTVLLADDHTMICAGLRKLLEPEYEVVACVGDGNSLVKTAMALRPDVALVDVTMPILNGLDAGRELKKLMPRLKLIFLTMNQDPEVASEALQIGASGYLLKDSAEEELLLALRNALRGISYITPRISHAMEQAFIRDPRSVSRPRHLSDRQREVLQLLAEGRPMKEIAHILAISHRTVRFHKYRIMEELGITNDSELVRYAIKHAIISPDVRGPQA